MQSLAELKAKLKQAEVEFEAQHNDRNSRLKSYTGRFRRPGESHESGTNSRRNLTPEYRATARDSSASWRKKDSRFIRPDSSEVYGKEDRRDKVRKQEESTAGVRQHQVSRSSENVHSQIRARKAADSCKDACFSLAAIISSV